MVDQTESLERKLKGKDWIPAIGFLKLGRDLRKSKRTLKDESVERIAAYTCYQTCSFVAAGAGIMVGWIKYCQPYYEQLIDKIL